MQTMVGGQLELARRIAVECTQVLKDCCVAVLAETRPMFLGAKSRCVICDNQFKGVQAGSFPMEEQRGRFTEVFASKGEGSVPMSVRTITLTKKRFATEQLAQGWLEKNGFSAEMLCGSPELWFAKQAPDGWFEDHQPRVVRMNDGVLGEVAVRKDDFVGKTPTERDFQDLPAVPKQREVKKAALTPSVEVQKDGMCPLSHPVLWKGCCWTRTAAAQGFPDAEVKKEEEEEATEEATEEAPAEATEEAPAAEETQPVAEDGTCPEGWTKKGEVCVRVAPAATVTVVAAEKACSEAHVEEAPPKSKNPFAAADEEDEDEEKRKKAEEAKK